MKSTDIFIVEMNYNEFLNILSEAVIQRVQEGWYDGSSHPNFSQKEMQKNLGKNLLFVDNGGHARADNITQPSTFDRNGANFRGSNKVLNPNQFMIYKIKNFGSPDINSTMDLFGKGSSGEKELRRAIDLVNGAATRSGRNVLYRTFTSEEFDSQSEKSGRILYTFWEFSLDGGQTWCILKPEPVTSMKISKMMQVS